VPTPGPRYKLEDARQSLDLVISDIDLPDGDGVELMCLVKDRLRCPAVALTGHGMGGDVRRCAEAGIDRHLLKPVGVLQLEREMKHLADC
jgi:CheY-like chemotaxis protein